jgi:hypothetical protein
MQLELLPYMLDVFEVSTYVQLELLPYMLDVIRWVTFEWNYISQLKYTLS